MSDFLNGYYQWTWIINSHKNMIFSKCSRFYRGVRGTLTCLLRKSYLQCNSRWHRHSVLNFVNKKIMINNFMSVHIFEIMLTSLFHVDYNLVLYETVCPQYTNNINIYLFPMSVSCDVGNLASLIPFWMVRTCISEQCTCSPVKRQLDAHRTRIIINRSIKNKL